MKLERFHSVREVRRLFYPSRSERWIKDTFRTGEFGAVLRDSSGWMISEVALAEYQRRHLVGALEVQDLPAGRRQNLVQFEAA